VSKVPMSVLVMSEGPTEFSGQDCEAVRCELPIIRVRGKYEDPRGTAGWVHEPTERIWAFRTERHIVYCLACLCCCSYYGCRVDTGGDPRRSRASSEEEAVLTKQPVVKARASWADAAGSECKFSGMAMGIQWKWRFGPIGTT
jgi:hypothetical protein